jgi:hypothetical protein
MVIHASRAAGSELGASRRSDERRAAGDEERDEEHINIDLGLA